MDAKRSSETLITTYNTARRHNTDVVTARILNLSEFPVVTEISISSHMLVVDRYLREFSHNLFSSVHLM